MGASSGKEVYSIYDSESYAAMDAYSFVEFVEVISILSFHENQCETYGIKEHIKPKHGTVGQEDRSLY